MSSKLMLKIHAGSDVKYETIFRNLHKAGMISPAHKRAKGQTATLVA
jgi:hypothetical protein